MKEFLQVHFDNEAARIFLMAVLGLIGGAVRVCGNSDHQQWKVVISSLMTAGFAGSLTGALLHERLTDPLYLGAVCALGGYCGQLVLVLLSKWLEKLLKGGMPR